MTRLYDQRGTASATRHSSLIPQPSLHDLPKFCRKNLLESVIFA